jgi:hypothetical protein
LRDLNWSPVRCTAFLNDGQLANSGHSMPKACSPRENPPPDVSRSD